MINACEAREQSENCRRLVVEDQKKAAEGAISAAILDGKFEAIVFFNRLPEREVVQELKAEGYQVSKGDSHLNISWWGI